MSDKKEEFFMTLMLGVDDSKLFSLSDAIATYVIHMSLMSVFRLVFNLGARHY
jgi:hypothetical protein